MATLSNVHSLIGKIIDNQEVEYAYIGEDGETYIVTEDGIESVYADN